MESKWKGTPLREEDLEAVQGGLGRQATTPSYAHQETCVIYTVASGDSLPSIASRFNVSVEELQQWNDLRSPHELRIGDKLTVFPRAMR